MNTQEAYKELKKGIVLQSRNDGKLYRHTVNGVECSKCGSVWGPSKKLYGKFINAPSKLTCQ